MNIRAIVIGLMNRLSAYAARESESDDAEGRKKVEDEAVAKLLNRLRISKEPKDDAPEPTGPETTGETEPQTNGAEADASAAADDEAKKPPESVEESEPSKDPDAIGSKRRSIPEDIKLYEVFYEQVTHLVEAQRLPIQDSTALLVSLSNLAL